MIKKITMVLFFFILKLGFSQVGIGVIDPIAELDVNGSMLVQNNFNLGRLPTVKSTDEDFKLLSRLTSSTPSGEISVLNVDSLSVAPINVVNYEFKNLKLDNLTDVDLRYNADKYIVAVSNFRYEGSAIKKTVVNNNTSIGAFVVRAFVVNRPSPFENTWHLEIRNRFLNLETNATKKIKYYVTLIIYDKSYFRNLTIIETNLNGSNSGTASSIPNL